MSDNSSSNRKRFSFRWGFLLMGIVVLIALGQLIGGAFSDFTFPFSSSQRDLGWKVALIGGVVYAILLSIPFFPGVELAWLIIFYFGKDAVILIYLCTLLGLSLSFIAGRRMKTVCGPFSEKLKILEDNYQKKFTSLTESIHGLFSNQTCNLYFNRLLRKSHYLILGILINIPGNSVLGGGGGIALLSGMNRSFSWKGFLIVSSISISPMPILLYFGILQIENFIGQ